MLDAELAYAFTTGMIVTVNPCGFAMLPAYLSFFVGVDAGGTAPRQDRPAAAHGVARALIVGLAVTVGFALTFAVVGLIVNLLTDGVYDVASWLSLVIGGALVVLGLALLAGFEPTLRLPHLDRGGRSTGIGSMVLFGISYAVASVGCTLGLFVATISTNFGRGLPSGIAFFLAYAAGFGLVVTSLTVALALARHSLVQQVRRLLPFVNRIAGALLVVTGAYVAYYGTVEIRQGSSQGVPRSTVVDHVVDWSQRVSNWINDTGATRIGAVLALALAAAAMWAIVARRRTRVGL